MVSNGRHAGERRLAFDGPLMAASRIFSLLISPSENDWHIPDFLRT